MKNKGPKMDPWGTPHLTVCIEEQVWLIWKIADGKKSSFLSTAAPHHGYYSPPAWWLRFDDQECQKLWRDLGTPTVVSRWSIAEGILFIRWIRAWDVE